MIARGDRAPDAGLHTPDGDRVGLAQEFHKGPTLLVFYKEECPACGVAIPRVPRFLEPYEGLGVWAISQDDAASTREFVTEKAPALPVLVDAPGYAASRAYGVDAVPALFLVSDGIVVDDLTGWDRRRFNELSRRAAGLVGAEYRELVPEGDGPEFRPG